MKIEDIKYVNNQFEKGRTILNLNSLFDCLALTRDHFFQSDDLKATHLWFNKLNNLIFYEDKDIQERSINSHGQVFDLENGIWKKNEFTLLSEEYDFIIHFILSSSSKSINFKNPFISFTASRKGINYRITIQLIRKSPKESKIFIRQFNHDYLSSKLWNLPETLLSGIQENNILISGATASGKTTLLKSILSETSSEKHLVTIEDLHEIGTPRENSTHLCSSEFNQDLDQLLQNALRMTPDLITLGEIRGKEVLTFVLTLNTGHRGAMSTIHANSAQDAIYRICELLQVYSDFGRNDMSVLMKLLTRNLKYVIHLEEKKIAEIIEIRGSSDRGTPIYSKKNLEV